MKILLVSATSDEIDPLLKEFNSSYSGRLGINDVEILVTGVGMVPTAFSMGRSVSEEYDMAVNAGIAGAFDRSLLPGEVVRVHRDEFAELGAEDGDNFLPIQELGFGEAVFNENYHHPALKNIKSVSAITVNRVHGNEQSIARTLSRTNAQIESMEGAAFFYACRQLSLPCIQLRSISNYVERRNRDHWNIPLAIRNLNKTLIEIIHAL